MVFRRLVGSAGFHNWVLEGRLYPGLSCGHRVFHWVATVTSLVTSDTVSNTHCTQQESLQRITSLQQITKKANMSSPSKVVEVVDVTYDDNGSMVVSASFRMELQGVPQAQVRPRCGNGGFFTIPTTGLKLESGAVLF